MSLALSVTACGDFVATAGVGRWQEVRFPPLRTSSMPDVRVDDPGTGPAVRNGSLVEVDIDILEPSSFHKDVPRRNATVWVWLASDPDKTDLGNWGLRSVLVGRNLGAVLTADAKSHAPGKRPPDFGSVFVYPEPFGESSQGLVVYDSVYRLKVKRSCPAQMFAAVGTYRELGFELGCRGDFIPTCDPSIVRSASLFAYKVVARCNGKSRTFVSEVFGQPPSRDNSKGFDRKLTQLRKDLASGGQW